MPRILILLDRRQAASGRVSAILAALSGTLAALAVIELLFRVFAPQPLALSYQTPLGLTLHLPGTTIRYARLEFDHLITINSLGLRDRELSPRKPPGTFRILILGDSYVEGKQVAFEETFTKRIEARLAAARPDRHWEVVNAGVSGYGTADEIKFFEVYGRDLGADLVILAFCVGNDVSDNELSRFFTWRDGKLSENPLRPLSAWERLDSAIKEFLTSRFHVMQFLRDRLHEIRARGQPTAGNEPTLDMPAVPVDPAAKERSWALTAELLERLRSLVAETGARFFLVAIPPRTQVRSDQQQAQGGESDELQKRLAAFARSRDVPFLDLLPPLREADRVEPAYYRIDAHFNGRGHAIAAEEIFQSLTKEGLLPESTGPRANTP